MIPHKKVELSHRLTPKLKAELRNAIQGKSIDDLLCLLYSDLPEAEKAVINAVCIEKFKAASRRVVLNESTLVLLAEGGAK